MKIKNAHKNALIVAAVAIVAIVLLVPGLLPSLGTLFTTTVSSCEDTPYDTDCFCELGVERKIRVPWLGIPKWSCENLEALLIDPESATFESDAIAFAEEYLSRWCPSVWVDTCGGYVCGCPPENPSCGGFASSHPIYPNQACISAVWGYGSQGARVANIECLRMNTWNTPQGELTHEETIAIYGNQYNANIQPSSGTAPWRMEFFVESETDTPTTLEVFVHSNYCYNALTEKKCTHQSICDYYTANPSDWTLAHPGWCVGNLPLNIVPTDYPMSFFVQQLGSGWPAPVP